MNVSATRWVVGVFCGIACSACPVAIVGLSMTYAEIGFDDGFDPWPVYAINGLFGVAVVVTAGLIWTLRPWWRWVGVAVSVPLLGLTALLAITGGMWVEGTYF